MGVTPKKDRNEVADMQRKEITYLWPHHRSMARALVTGGLQPKVLAEIFGYSQTQISVIMNSPLFQAEVKRLEGAEEEDIQGIMEDIKRMAKRAVEVLDEQLTVPGIEPKIRQRAAFDVLDRAGYGKKTDGKPAGTQINLTKIEKIINNTSVGELKDEVIDLIELKPTGTDENIS